MAGTVTITTADAAVAGTATTFFSSFGTRTGTGVFYLLLGSSTTINGVGTKWLTELAVDDVIGNTTHGFARVTKVNSDTTATISSAINFNSSGVVTIMEQPTIEVTGETARKVRNITSNTALVTEGANWATNRTGVTAFTGTPCASLWLYIWVLKGASGTTVALSTQRTTPLLSIAGYDQDYRRVGALRIASTGNLIPVTYNTGVGSRTALYQADLTFDGVDLQVVANASSTASPTDILCNVAAPPGARAIHLVLSSRSPNTVRTVYVHGLNCGDQFAHSRSVTAPSTSTRDDRTFLVPCTPCQILQHNVDAAVSATGDGTYVEIIGYDEDVSA